MNKLARLALVVLSFYLAISFLLLASALSDRNSTFVNSPFKFGFFSLNGVQQSLLDYRGLINSIDNEDDLIWLADRNKQNRQIIDGLEKLLSVSPLSANLWNQLLYRRLSVGLLDSETEKVFNNAILLDSWYSKQRNRFIRICFSYWQAWSAATQSNCRDVLEATPEVNLHLIKRLTGLTESRFDQILEEISLGEREQ